MTVRLASKLYAIADPEVAGTRDVEGLVREMAAGGARTIQLRWKDAPSGPLLATVRRLVPWARERGVLLVVNDRPDVALAAGAAGVHLGQEDLPLADVRKLLGPAATIGVSTHSLEQAAAAWRDGADYIGFGPLFATTTKQTRDDPRGLELLARVTADAPGPVVAIGGIDETNALTAIEAGASAVAMIAALVRGGSPRDRVHAVTAILDG